MCSLSKTVVNKIISWLRTRRRRGKRKEMPNDADVDNPSTSKDQPSSSRKKEENTPRKLHRKCASSSSSEEEDEVEENERATRKRERNERDGPLEGLKEMVCSKFRVIVSQNRRRIKTDGFDLDLTYITDRIIAMGYPANATEALYRNSMKHIIRFLEKRHRDHYKVFNLRGQYSYDPANFKNRVISFEMTDHHPPRLELMAPFCREVHEWITEDPRNVVAVHCKAGKGRTGVMICAYLSYCQFYPSPRQNMDYYSVVRTRNNKGVTIPSQRRYVYYYDHLRKHHLNYLPLRVQLIGIYIERPPRSKGPLMKDQLSLRIANGDVDVYYGQPMNISDETWAEEELAWSGGNVIASGKDSYDPNDPCENDVISRRAYGWTVPASKPVFLEGDVRVDLYVHRKFINIFTSTGRNKLGHIWFNTMFTCAGGCGGEPYIHGDEAHPYPEGETTIAEKKHKFQIGDDENAPCASSYVPISKEDHNDEDSAAPIQKPSLTQSENAVGTSAPLSTRSAQSKSSPILANEKAVQKKLSKNETRKSKMGKVRKFFSTSDGAKSRASEPSIHVSASTDAHRTSNPESMPNRPAPINFNELQISQPPGLDSHCPDESLQRIYIDTKRQPPRYAINKMLAEAHEKDIVQDNYNERRRSVPNEGEPVKCAPDGRPDANGPNRIVRNSDEHVTVFPIMEVDRACKNESINNGFKLYVVTRCIEPKTYRHAEAFMNVTHEKQKIVNDEVYAKSQRGKSYVDLEPKLADLGAGKTWPPVIQYGNVGMAGNGGEAETLTDEVYRSDLRARDERYCRFFYKQRRNSISRYPSASHVCPLTGQCMEGSMRSERLNTLTSYGETSKGERATTPIDNSGVNAEAKNLEGGENAEVDLELDIAVDMDVRSYHPDPAAAKWEHSTSSRSSSSSEDVQMQPNSSMMTTDYSGVDSSMNEQPPGTSPKF
ncbi:unnamed protein product [Caenorhabditis angaria]|uniref:Phosphatidylinositol-3,4,5-trisphosphate 3-phosphatase n=1 Tax=Caenorhabditis angaria TaxID=860376 RepID=A0A9P1IRB1_9PELO|nr:unnamed protein product [Caenorhabditis angaria]